MPDIGEASHSRCAQTNMQVLVICHSSRDFLDGRASINALEARFSKRDLGHLPPLDTFPDITTATPNPACLTFWKIVQEPSLHLEFLHQYSPDFPVQFVDKFENRVFATGGGRLVALDLDLESCGEISDPWISGTHTVQLSDDGTGWVTSAPANAILRFDPKEMTVIERVKMPECYGHGHDISPIDDLRQHMIPTDFQPTHVNCATPIGDGVLVTSWIPGAVGYFDAERKYREIIRGFRGLHGARQDASTEHIYVTDSPSGAILEIDFHTGKILSRTKLDSRWVHDSVKITDNLFAASLTDRNEVVFVDTRTGEIQVRHGCHAFGETTRFLTILDMPDTFGAKSPPAAPQDPSTIDRTWEGPNLLPLEVLYPFWDWDHEQGQLGFSYSSARNLAFEYLFTSEPMTLYAGKYGFGATLECHRGAVSVMVIDDTTQQPIVSMLFGGVMEREANCFQLKVKKRVKVILAAANTAAPAPIEFSLRELRIVSFDQVTKLRLPFLAETKRIIQSIYRPPWRALLGILTKAMMPSNERKN